MQYQINASYWNRLFAVPEKIITEHLASCSAVHLKVILLIFHEHPDPIVPEKIAQRLSLPVSDIKDALNYWVHTDILESTDSSRTESAIKKPETPKSSDAPLQDSKALLDYQKKPVNARLTASEIHDMTQKQPVIRSLLHETEGILGKTLTSADMSTILSLYDWAGMSPENILMVVAYCASMDKKNLRYIEKTALSWIEMGLDNDAAIEAYLQKQSVSGKQHREVQSAFGIHERKLSTKEKEYIEKWFETFQFSIDMIRLAYEKTVDNTGKVSFPYIDKILSSWAEKGYKKPADVKETKPEKAGGKKEYSFNLEEHVAFISNHTPKIE